MNEVTAGAAIIKAIAKSSLIESIRDGLVDFLGDQAKDLGKKEISDRIAKLRSDAKLREQMQAALERAVERWARDYSDRDLVAAVAESTEFADLTSVQQAIRTIAQHPFDPIAAETLQGKFGEVLPPRIEAARMERAVMALLEFLQEEFARVPALQQTQAVAAVIRTARSTERTAENTESLQRIEVLLERMLKGSTPTDETLQDYLTWVTDQHRYLDPRGVMQTVRQVQVRLQDIYVSLTAEAEPLLSATDRPLYEHELEALLDREGLSPEEREDLRENLLARYQQEKETAPKKETVDLTGLVREHPKLVILGDPGAGKTTLLRYLALRHALALRQGENEMQDLGPARLPFYLRIAHYAEHGKGSTLSNFLPSNVRGRDEQDQTLADLISTRLSGGTCLVLLDGLDEIIEPDQRAEIAGQIDAFIRAHEKSGNRFVVTSRVAGYRTAPLAGDMAHYRVCDMNDDQIRRFLEQWCLAVERFQTPELSPDAQAAKAQAEIDHIAHAIEANPGVRRLATNPLLLRTLALIHRTGARLPQRRIELYRLAADTLIRDWELARGVPEKALVGEAEATRLLSELAAWMHQEKPAGIATEGRVRAKLAEVKGRLMGKEPDHPDVQDAVSDFLERIRQHTGLFVERAPRRYGFMHLTFQEYFSARWLVAKPRQASRRIRMKLHQPRWQEPILLAIAFYGMEFPDDVDDLIEESVLGKDLGGSSPYEDILRRDLLFAVRCLGDQDVSAGLGKRLVSKFVQVWVDPSLGGRYRALRQQMGQIAKDLAGSAAQSALAELLLVALHDESGGVRWRAADALGDAPPQAEVVSGLLAALHDDSAYVRERAAGALGNASAQAEVVSGLLAALQDDAECVRGSAACALGNATAQADVVLGLLAALQDEEADVRGRAADALGNATAQADVVLGLLAALQDAAEGVRKSAASALGNATGQAEVVFGLLVALQDEDHRVRESAASALGNATAQAEVVSGLLAALHDEDSYVRWCAVDALWNARAQGEVVSGLLAALHDEDWYVHRRSAGALGKATAQAEVVSGLLAALHDEDYRVRDGAAYALGKGIAQAEVVSGLLVALHDEDREVRWRAAYALGNVTAQADVVLGLLAALQDEDQGVRWRAADALGNATAQADVVLGLLAALQDEEADVRWRAADALGNATAQAEVVSGLLAALHDEDRGVRGSAADALGKATAQAEVVSGLLAALHDESADVRGRAASALGTATAQAEVVSGLLAGLHDESADVRGRAASALGNATAQAEVVSGLLVALHDEGADVRGSAFSALARLARRPDARLLPDLPAQLAAALDLEGLDAHGLYGRPRDSVFEALAAVAPVPKVEMAQTPGRGRVVG